MFHIFWYNIDSLNLIEELKVQRLRNYTLILLFLLKVSVYKITNYIWRVQTSDGDKTSDLNFIFRPPFFLSFFSSPFYFIQTYLNINFGTFEHDIYNLFLAVTTLI